MSDVHLPVRHLLQQLDEGRYERLKGLQLPEWMETFIERAVDQFEPESEAARAGYVCSCGDDGWQVTLFLGMTELVGGADDGARVPTGFQFDLHTIGDCFDRVERVMWLALPAGCQSNSSDIDESSLVIDGIVKGQRVQLCVALRPPEEIGPGLLRDADGRYTPAP